MAEGKYSPLLKEGRIQEYFEAVAATKAGENLSDYEAKLAPEPKPGTVMYSPKPEVNPDEDSTNSKPKS